MGCSPAKGTAEVSPIKSIPDPKPSQAISKPPQNPSSSMPTSEKVPPKRSASREGSSSNRDRPRNSSVKSTERLRSPSPGQRDSLGNTALPIIIDSLFQFQEEIENSNSNYQDTLEYVRVIINNLSNNFENSEFKSIKKSDADFLKFISRFSQGIPFLKTLGFQEKNDVIVIDENFNANNAKNKAKEFEQAVSRVAIRRDKQRLRKGQSNNV